MPVFGSGVSLVSELFSHGQISGKFYNPVPAAAIGVGATWSVAGQIAFLPFIVPKAVTIKAIGVGISTAFTGGLAAAGIYANDPTLGQPTGLPIASVSGISLSFTGSVSVLLATPFLLPAGIYWMAVQLDNTTAILRTIATAAGVVGAMMGSATLSNITGGLNYFVQTGTYPTLATAAAFAEQVGNRNGIAFLQVN